MPGGLEPLEACKESRHGKKREGNAHKKVRCEVRETSTWWLHSRTERDQGDREVDDSSMSGRCVEREAKVTTLMSQTY